MNWSPRRSPSHVPVIKVTETMRGTNYVAMDQRRRRKDQDRLEDRGLSRVSTLEMRDGSGCVGRSHNLA